MCILIILNPDQKHLKSISRGIKKKAGKLNSLPWFQLLHFILPI